MKKAFRIGATILAVIATAYGAWRYYWWRQYPYGFTHRCSGCFAPFLEGYAETHGGKYPQPERDDQLGMDRLWEDDPKMIDTLFDLVVGKAGDLDEARKFYDEHGYLRREHSSWHYVTGLSSDDEGRALAWDKIPLTHNGGRVDSNPREVIMVGGYVRVVIEDRWEEFLQAQRELAGGPDKANTTE